MRCRYSKTQLPRQHRGEIAVMTVESGKSWLNSQPVLLEMGITKRLNLARQLSLMMAVGFFRDIPTPWQWSGLSEELCIAQSVVSCTDSIIAKMSFSDSLGGANNPIITGFLNSGRKISEIFRPALPCSEVRNQP